MRPQAVRHAAAYLILGATISLNIALALATVSVGLWCTAWTYAPVVSLFAIGVGFWLGFGRPSPLSRPLGVAAAVLQMGQLINCDPTAPIFAVLAISQLSKPESVAWFSGTIDPAPPTLGPGQTGIRLDLSHFPLAFLYLFCTPEVRVGAEVRRLSWGSHVLPLPPGPVELSFCVPYLLSRSNRASRVVEVPDGEGLNVRYWASGLVFLPGTLNVLPLTPATTPPSTPTITPR